MGIADNNETSLLIVQPTVPITGLPRIRYEFETSTSWSKEASPESQGENDPGVRCF